MVHDVKTDTLKENDIILVKPGEKVAADGVILEGESYLNESMLTGESKPVHKVRGDNVNAGAINGNGSFKVTVSHAAKDMLTYRRLLNWWTMPKSQSLKRSCWPIQRRNG